MTERVIYVYMLPQGWFISHGKFEQVLQTYFICPVWLVVAVVTVEAWQAIFFFFDKILLWETLLCGRVCVRVRICVCAYV